MSSPVMYDGFLYTTNAIEALSAKLRRAVRARGHFPSDEAATKLLFLVLNRRPGGTSKFITEVTRRDPPGPTGLTEHRQLTPAPAFTQSRIGYC
jgi:mutator family transposase